MVQAYVENPQKPEALEYAQFRFKYSQRHKSQLIITSITRIKLSEAIKEFRCKKSAEKSNKNAKDTTKDENNNNLKEEEEEE